MKHLKEQICYADFTNTKIVVLNKTYAKQLLVRLEELSNKEEPIELSTVQNEHLGINYVCKCGNIVGKCDNYCSKCGQKIKKLKEIKK